MLSFIDKTPQFKLEDKKPETTTTPPTPNNGVNPALLQLVYRFVNMPTKGGLKTDPLDPTKQIQAEPWSAAAELMIPYILEEIINKKSMYFIDNKPHASNIKQLVESYLSMFYILMTAFADTKIKLDTELLNKK